MLAITLQPSGKSSRMVWFIEDQEEQQVLVIMTMALAETEYDKVRIIFDAPPTIQVLRDGDDGDPWPPYCAQKLAAGWTIVEDKSIVNGYLAEIFGDPTPRQREEVA